MGRFLGGSSPMGSDNARRGRRYEALPADNADPDDRSANHQEEDDHEDHHGDDRQPLTRGRSSSSGHASEAESDAEQQQQQVQAAETTASAKGVTPEVAAAESVQANDAADAQDASPEESAADDTEQLLEPGAIRVRILDLNGKFFNIQCRLDWTVAAMKQKVLECTEVPVAAQRLIFRGRVLEDAMDLAEYKVEDGHTIHLFVRMTPTPEEEQPSSDASAITGTSIARLEDGTTMTIVHISSENISSAVFPSDSARRVDPLMLDSPLGNCARRVKLWSSFLLIIYTMKVMGQFALLANDQQARQQQQNSDDQAADPDGGGGNDQYDYPQYMTNQDPLIGVIELMIHAFGVYVGCVGFKAAHDTDIRPIRFYCRGVVWLAILTIAEQIYITVQFSQSDYPSERIQYPYGAQAPSKEDIVSANIFQTVMLFVMWIVAVHHSYMHQAEVSRYNESFASAAMNAVPPAHLPEVV